jgi:broad specificity phosphatase PhoE
LVPVEVAGWCEDASYVRDAPLTELGKQQSRDLCDRFDKHDISLVLSSPLMHAIQTTAIAFAPTITWPDVEYLLIHKAQEVSAKTCDVGFPPNDLKKRIEKYFEGKTWAQAWPKLATTPLRKGGTLR